MYRVLFLAIGVEPMSHLERRWSALQDLSGYTAGTIADRGQV